MILSVDQLPDPVLQSAIAHGVRFTRQQHGARFQRVAALDDAFEKVKHVVDMDKGLARLHVAGKSMALEIPFVDARDLV